LHELRETAVLRDGRSADLVERHETVLPAPAKPQALLRAVHEVALVVFPAAGDTPAQAQFFEEVLHVGRILAGHRKTVGAPGTRDAVQGAGAAVAARGVFEIEQHEVLDAARAQRARRREARDAGAGDDDVRAEGPRRGWERAQVAQLMAARKGSTA